MKKKKVTKEKTPLQLFTSGRNWTKALVMNINTIARNRKEFLDPKEQDVMTKLEFWSDFLITNWDANTKEVIERFENKIV